jgi:hypothetical protein
MAKPWRCRLRLHRWQRLRGPDGQWYRECRDCGTQLINRYKEGPRPPRSADPASDTAVATGGVPPPSSWWPSPTAFALCQACWAMSR